MAKETKLPETCCVCGKDVPQSRTWYDFSGHPFCEKCLRKEEEAPAL